jgi:hypothetical protein
MTIKTVFQSLGLSTVLAVGFVVVWGLFASWALQIGMYVAGATQDREVLVFLADGTPRVVHYDSHSRGRRYRDLEGNPVPPPESEAGDLVTVRLRTAPSSDLSAGPVAWEHRICSFTDGQTPAVYWYFLSDGRADGTGYFVGYDSQSKVRVGYLGRAGFLDREPAVEERFPCGRSMLLSSQPMHNPTEHPENRTIVRARRGDLSPWKVYVAGLDSRIYQADLQTRTVRVVLDEPGLRTATLTRTAPDREAGAFVRLAARTGNSVLVLDDSGTVQQRYPIPAELREKTWSFAETTAGEALVYRTTPFENRADQNEHRILHISPGGNYRETAIVLPAGGSGLQLQVTGGVVFPSPLFLAGMVSTVIAQGTLVTERAATWPDALALAWAESALTLLVAQVVAAGLAVLCYRRQVRYAAGGLERVVWPVFVLLLGLPGWIGYRFGRTWPALEACPECGAVTPRDREACAGCAVEVAPPALRGTEVFA